LSSSQGFSEGYLGQWGSLFDLGVKIICFLTDHICESSRVLIQKRIDEPHCRSALLESRLVQQGNHSSKGRCGGGGSCEHTQNNNDVNASINTMFSHLAATTLNNCCVVAVRYHQRFLLHRDRRPGIPHRGQIHPAWHALRVSAQMFQTQQSIVSEAGVLGTATFSLQAMVN